MRHWSTPGVAMLRRATSAMSDSSLCAVGHTSDDRGCTAAMDYGNGVQVGLPAYLTRQSINHFFKRRLQSVLNTAARLIYRLRTRDHVSDAVTPLHWLWVPVRIQYKLAVLAYKGGR